MMTINPVSFCYLIEMQLIKLHMMTIDPESFCYLIEMQPERELERQVG